MVVRLRCLKQLVVTLKKVLDKKHELEDLEVFQILVLLDSYSDMCRERLNQANDCMKNLLANNVPLSDIAWSGAMVERGEATA